MKTRCEALKMTCSDLIEASTRDPGSLGILCGLVDSQDGILGWGTCANDTRSHFLQSKPTIAQTKPRVQEKKGNPTRRPYFKQEQSPQNVIPFKHHTDLSMYTKDYTKYQSFTMGQDTDYVVRYELTGPSRSVYSRWKDQFSSLGVRGEGVQDDQRPGFSYVHNPQEKSGQKKTVTQGHHGQEQPLVYHKDQQLKKPHDAPTPSSSTIPDGSVVDKHANASITLTGSKGDTRNKKQKNQEVKESTGKAGVKSLMAGAMHYRENTLDVQGHSPHGPYGSIEEYYVKQIEKEFREKMRNSRDERGARQGHEQRDGHSDGYGDIQPIVQPIQHRASKKPPYVVDHTESDPYSPDPAARNVPQNRKSSDTPEDFEHEDGSHMLKLPPLQEHVDNIAASHEREKETRASVPKLSFPKRKKGSKMGGKKFTNSKYYMDLPSPSRRFAKDTNDVPDYKTAIVHQSIPPLASVYSSPDDTATANRKRPPQGSGIVLPKLHKWLSDSAVHKVIWDESQENKSPEPSYRSLKATSNQRVFSQEFMEYANQLHNREAITKLYDGQNSGRYSPGVERETQSLPDIAGNPNGEHGEPRSVGITHNSPEQIVNALRSSNENRDSLSYEQHTIPHVNRRTQEQMPSKSSRKHVCISDNAQFIVVSSHVGPPPNTPNEVFNPAMSITQLRHPKSRIKDHEIYSKTAPVRGVARQTKKVGAKVRMPKINLLPEPEKTTVRTNEHVVEVVGSLPSMAGDRDGPSKYLSSSLAQGRAVWRS